MEGNHRKPEDTEKISFFTSRDLAILWPIPFSQETELSKVEIALRERIKELNCLYGLSQLAERHSSSISGLLGDLANFLPLSWQYPEITRARINFKGEVFQSRGFKSSKWRMSSRIYMYSEPAGEVEIFYVEERPAADEGPFLKEERALLDALADQIGTIAARIAAENELHEINKRLTVEQKALQESNVALRAVLSRIEEEKQEIRRNIHANVEKILLPVLHALALELPAEKRRYAEILRQNLEEIAAPFVNRLSRSFQSLTPTEISICNLIRMGLRTKEIAENRGVSAATINRHRENIRRKLGLTNGDVNLSTFLQSNMWEGQKGP